MQLEHSFTVPVGVDEAWSILTDLGAVAPSMPNGKVSSAAPGRVEGSLKVKLGPLNLNYTGSASVVELDSDARRAVVRADGDTARNGSASATVVATVTADGDAALVTLVTELEVTGKPGQFGHNVMSDVGSRVVEQFAAALAEAIGSGAFGTARRSTASAPPDEPEATVVEAPAESPVEALDPPAEAAMPLPEQPAVDDPTTDDPAELTDAPAKPRPRPRRETEPAAQASPEPADEPERAVEAAIEAEAAGEPADVTPTFVASAGLPPVTEATVTSVNGHGSPTPPSPPPSAGSKNLADLARPALVRGVAPVTLAVIFVLGALRRRRRG